MNENSVDLDTLSGVPSEKVFDKLLSDATFVDYFNTFLSLPVFGKKLSYNKEDDNFNIDPPPPRTCYHVPKHRVKKWVRKERIKFFWKTDLFLEYTLCVKLHNASDYSSTTVNSDEVRNFLGTVEDMHKFLIFLRGTAGHRILIFWIDAERYRRVTKKEHRRFAFREIQAKYLLSGSPRELPEIIKWTSLCGGSPHPCRTSSFTFPKSITKRMYLSDSSIFSENVFIPGQKMALERLSSYWVPKYIQHKKIIKKRIAEKRGVHCEFRAETVSLKPVPEVDNPVSKTRFEKDVDDFMDAHHVSSTESMSEEEIRAQQLEEWKRWFWEGVDSQTGSEPKVEPPKDMPTELRLLGGIRGEDATPAPPSSPVPLEEESTPLNAIAESEEEEEEQLSSSESQEIINGRIYSASFSHPERVGIVSPPKERSQSLPGLSSFDLTYWRKKKPKKEEPEVDTEYSEPEEVIDPMFLPRLIPRYAKTPSSSPRKLKTFYEALASERSTSSGNYSGSSSESPSPKSSLSVSPQPTVIVALERSSASRIIPLKDVRQEITAAVNEPRAAYPRETPLGERFILPIGDKDVPTSSDHVHNPPVAVALTADKLAGGPLREYLEKTQENMALRCLQFCEDVQRYLSPPENFGSYSKYHTAKTLIATYIAPDSPREMPLSPQIRADLMRHLPQESGNSLLSSVVKASVKAVASPWSEFVRSDEEHFVNSVGIRRKNVKKLKDVESEKGAERAGNKIWQAFKLAVSVGMSGFSFGQDDEDKDEREAREDGFRIPGYKQKKEEVDPRKRRPSHFYGHMSKQGDEGSDANKGILTTKIRPPKPRCFNDVLHDTLQLMWFRRFLSEKNCEAPLLFWQAVENMKTNCKDGKARQARAMIITKKYFINISVPAVEYLHCKADIIKDIPLLDKTTPPLLVSAQACVARSMEENWYTEYVATFPDDESERENFQKYAMRNTLAGVYRMAAHGKTKGLWAVFAHHIMCFQRGITHPDSLREFKQFLKKESKATVEQNIRRHAVNPTRRMINNQFVNTDRLISDLEFWMEVQRFKDQADYATECARLGNYTLEDEHLLLDKAKTIVKCYIDSDVPPRVQINTANDLAENIVGLVSSGIVERGLFHEAALSVFSHLMFFWKKFSAEKINKPPEEPKPPIPSKRGSSRKRVMSMVGGMPYRKLYVAQDEELHWSYTLSHGLRLNMPLRLVIAKRVATQMENPSTDNRPSAVSISRPTH